MRVFLLIWTFSLALPVAASATSVPSTDAAGPDEYTLQVATYSDRSDAAKVIDTIPDAWIQEVRLDGKTLFRVNYRRFEAREHALRAQWDLEDLGFKGFIQRIYT